jgi:hypothetical protein
MMLVKGVMIDPADQLLMNIQAPRYLTAEGHNTYSADSGLGKKVVELGENVAFGELALLENNPRAATIKCESSCELLVIKSSDFQAMFGTQLNKAKVTLFMDRVPGFIEWANRNQLETHVDAKGRRVAKLFKHPSDLFKQQNVDAGHVFLQEGVIEEPQIILIEFGEVEYRKKSYQFPRKVAMSTPSCWDNPAKPSAFRPPKTSGKPLMQSDTCWHRLGSGMLFCSLRIFDVPCTEPFSVVASQNCQVFTLTGKDVRDLEPNIRLAIERHLVEKLRPVLWHSPAVNSVFSLPLEYHPPKTTPPHYVLQDFEDEDDNVLS